MARTNPMGRPSMGGKPARASRQRRVSSSPPGSPSGPSSNKRVKRESSHSTDEDEDEVKPDIKPKLEDFTPSVTSVSHGWLKHTDPDKLEKLLLDASRSFAVFDSLLNKTIKEDAALLDGDGDVEDFKVEAAYVQGRIRDWEGAQPWSQIFKDIGKLAEHLTSQSPLLSRINALKEVANLIDIADSKVFSGRVMFREDECPWDMWRLLRGLLQEMTDADRRKHIDADLVKSLDKVIKTKGTRSLYGRKGREVGDVETEDEDD